MAVTRLSMAVKANSRDSSRVKGSWGVNCFVEGGRAQKRPGISAFDVRGNPGQGMYNWNGLTVSVGGDVLQVDADTFPL